MSDYRFMRLILFFDLPVETAKNRKDYRSFIKNIKCLGFYMLQKSVYIKLNIDLQGAQSTIKKVKLSSPPEGDISIIKITEKQFANMELILGSIKSDTLSDDRRMVEI